MQSDSWVHNFNHYLAKFCICWCHYVKAVECSYVCLINTHLILKNTIGKLINILITGWSKWISVTHHSCVHPYPTPQHSYPSNNQIHITSAIWNIFWPIFSCLKSKACPIICNVNWGKHKPAGSKITAWLPLY